MKIKSIIKLEVAGTFLLLMHYIGALGLKVPITGEGFSHFDPQNLIERTVAILAYLLIPLLISRKWKLCLYLLTKDIPLVLLLLLANFSIIWTYINLNNISSLRGLLLSTLFGVYLAARFSIKDQARLLAGVFAIVILSSIFVALFVPGYGTHGEASNLTGWTGILAHKNHLGARMAWSASIFLSLSLSISKKHLNRLALWAGFALSVLLVFLAGSAGGIINLVGVISIVPLSKFFKKTYYKLQVLLIVSTILIIGGIFTLIVANLETIAELLGKDLTFSGRLPMWSNLSSYIAQKPLLGYGFNGFWDAKYGQFFRARWAWADVPHSHNGFIELLLALGLIGFLLFTISFLFVFLRSFKQAHIAKTLEDIVPMQFIFTFLIANMSESELLIANNIYWVIYVAMSLSLARKDMQERKLSRV